MVTGLSLHFSAGHAGLKENMENIFSKYLFGREESQYCGFDVDVDSRRSEVVVFFSVVVLFSPLQQ